MTVGTNLFFIAALLLTLILTGTTVRADTSLNGLGDIGCNDTAKNVQTEKAKASDGTRGIDMSP